MTFARAAQRRAWLRQLWCSASEAVSVMVEAILLQPGDSLDAETKAADEEEDLSPEGAINLLLRLMSPDTASRDATDGLLLVREDIRNLRLRERGAAWGRALVAALGRRLSRDQQGSGSAGLADGCSLAGCAYRWAFDQTVPADRAIREALEAWLKGRQRRDAALTAALANCGLPLGAANSGRRHHFKRLAWQGWRREIVKR